MNRKEFQMEEERTSISKNQIDNQDVSIQFIWFIAITGTVFAGSGIYLVVWLLLKLA